MLFEPSLKTSLCVLQKHLSFLHPHTLLIQLFIHSDYTSGLYPFWSKWNKHLAFDDVQGIFNSHFLLAAHVVLQKYDCTDKGMPNVSKVFVLAPKTMRFSLWKARCLCRSLIEQLFIQRLSLRWGSFCGNWYGMGVR